MPMPCSLLSTQVSQGIGGLLPNAVTGIYLPLADCVRPHVRRLDPAHDRRSHSARWCCKGVRLQQCSTPIAQRSDRLPGPEHDGSSRPVDLHGTDDRRRFRRLSSEEMAEQYGSLFSTVRDAPQFRSQVRRSCQLRRPAEMLISVELS